MTHDFDKDFNFSTSATADAITRRACHRLIPGCCGVTRASPDDDKRGIDYWVRTGSGRVGLDLKLRRQDYGAARDAAMDCVIELDGAGSSGWLTKPTAAALILFACADTHRVALFETCKLRLVVLQNLGRWIAQGRAKELTTKSHRDGRQWENCAVIINADLLTSAIDQLDGFGAAANDEDFPA
jgi:hypothetical protein